MVRLFSLFEFSRCVSSFQRQPFRGQSTPGLVSVPPGFCEELRTFCGERYFEISHATSSALMRDSVLPNLRSFRRLASAREKVSRFNLLGHGLSRRFDRHDAFHPAGVIPTSRQSGDDGQQSNGHYLHSAGDAFSSPSGTRGSFYALPASDWRGHAYASWPLPIEPG